MIAILFIHLRFPGCASLKEKRSHLKPILVRLRREFNVSTAELELQDQWAEALIGCAMLGSDAAFLQAALETVLRWVEANWAYGDVWDSKIEILS